MTLAELAEELRSGAITVSQWETSMRDFLRSEYETALILAKGGRENVTFSDWGYEGSLLKKQYQYLSNFAKEISANPTAWMSGRLDARMGLYGESAYTVLEDFRRREAEAQGYTEEIRHLHATESCPDCIAAGEHWEPIGTLPVIGDSVCIVNCKCDFGFRKPDGATSEEAGTETTTGDGKSNNINMDVDTSNMPLARSANWEELKDPEYRDYQRARAEKGKDVIVAPELDRLNDFATNPAFELQRPEEVFFGLQGDKFKSMEVGDTFSALGTRSTSFTVERALAYGKDGGVFKLEVPAGTQAVFSKVFDIQELMLLPDATFEVVSIKNGITTLSLINDGSNYTHELFMFQQELERLAALAKGRQ